MPVSPQDKDSTLNWLVKSMGFVDKVCCYAYSEQQVYSEPDAVVYSSQVPSWDMADEDIVYREHERREPVKHYEMSEAFKMSKNQPNQVYNYTYKHHRPTMSTARSTASTVTTSTTTTVVTSTRYTTDSSNGSISTLEDQDKFYGTPPEIYLRSEDNSQTKDDGIVLDASQRVTFTSATEGYPC